MDSSLGTLDPESKQYPQCPCQHHNMRIIGILDQVNGPVLSTLCGPWEKTPYQEDSTHFFNNLYPIVRT